VPEDSFVDCSFTDLTVAGWHLGHGEAEVLSFARANPEFTAVVDDLHACKWAISLGLRLQRTVGALLLAKKPGLVQQLPPALGDVQANDMHLSAKLIDKALRLAGEGV
jgi:uncharacterized protein